MNHHRRYAGLKEPICACLVGGGAFGQSFLAQARFIRRITARIAVDLTAEAAGVALAAAGFAKADIRLCTTPQEAKAAFDAGHAVAAGSLDTVIGLPFHILVEATA
jgi:predicted homoserine dehydrogenase-like protein